ncbi:MAG TPA: STAS domain-containing protein [Thermoanaerobaculia bacterium]|nr:STAS domain-containing protein [Thermoanaerobaculia bacterium]
MQVEESREGGILVVVPEEPRLDAYRAGPFKTALTGLVDAGHHQLVLDLAGVEFMDSTGLSAVVSILKRLGFYGVLVICGARGAVADLFRLTRMDRVIQLVPTREEALAVARSEAMSH